MLAVIPVIAYDTHFTTRNLKIDYRGISNGKAYITFRGENDAQGFTLQAIIIYK